MALGPGTRLGVYEILSLLGSGGMGEVYRARDHKLDRDVAIKVLPDPVAGDPERLARFEREAKTVAALSHPNIAQVHGFDDATGTPALVMELVEGPTLADRIAKGAIPLDEALAIAKQIAEGLEAAHEQGIIHRDLKPANIKVRDDGTVKILDFGLAKALEPKQPSGINVTQSPTITTPAMMTGVGVILGTAAYMSPEQAKGRPADKRSDIWAFGCVLYEMLAGKRPFLGDDVSDTLAAVLRGEPDWAAVARGTPQAVSALIKGCLERDRRRRIGDISAARFVLNDLTTLTVAAAIVPEPSPAKGRWLAAAVVLVVGMALAVAAWMMRAPAVHTDVVRFFIPMAQGGQQATNRGRRAIAISPDGQRIAFMRQDHLFVRSLADREAKSIVERQAGAMLFSPDGLSLVYSSGRTLQRIPITGGAGVPVCDVGDAPYGMSWSGPYIYFSDQRRVLRVAASGGKPEVLLEVAIDERIESPQLLPDGDTLLFTRAKGGLVVDRWEKAEVITHSLKSGTRKVVIQGGADARYVQTGHLLYVRGGVLFAVPFDPAHVAIRGAPVPVVEGIERSAGSGPSFGQYDVAQNGTLIFVAGPTSIGPGQMVLASVDRDGSAKAFDLPKALYQFPRFSPDGTRVAYGIDDGQSASIWVHDLSAQRAPLRLTYEGRNRFPVWSGDGQWLMFQSDREGDTSLFRQRADGTGVAERLTHAEQGTAHVPHVSSAKGDVLLLDVVKQSDFALTILSLTDKRMSPFRNVHSPNPTTAALSPDGRWVAYSMRPQNQVYNTLFVEPFPPTGSKYQITDDDGHHPAWSPDGKSLFFILRPGRFAEVPVSTTNGFSFGAAVDIPRGFLTSGPATVEARTYDVDPGRPRFVGVVNPAAADVQATGGGNQIEIVLNWSEELKARAPTR